MYVLSTAQMREAEQYAIKNMGVPSIILMENAARGAVNIILNEKPKNALVFAGKGNNGGDGLAIARLLITKGINVRIYFIGDKEKASPDCFTNLSILENYNADILYGYNNENISKYDVIIDALVGTGLKRRLSDEYINIVNAINSSGCRVISVDCPTGVNSDTGEDYGIAVNADITVTFHRAKIGLMLYPAYGHIGKLYVSDIGVPFEGESDTFILDSIDMPKRDPNSNKGNYGKALIIAGSDAMTGAAVLNCKAAYKIGAGLVNLCSTDHAVSIVQSILPEAVTTKRENIDYTYGNVCAIGSGLGINTELAEDTVINYKGKLVIDADGLNSIADDTDILYKLNNECVITPHIKEMSRLTGYDTDYIKSNIINVAKEFANKYNITVVLKDAHTVITNGRKTCINITGTPAMSKGGTGDCLCGVITGLIAQGVDLFDAACMGAYINGRAGEYAQKKLGCYSVMAEDIIDNIPNVLGKY